MRLRCRLARRVFHCGAEANGQRFSRRDRTCGSARNFRQREEVRVRAVLARLETHPTWRRSSIWQLAGALPRGLWCAGLLRRSVFLLVPRALGPRSTDPGVACASSGRLAQGASHHNLEVAGRSSICCSSVGARRRQDRPAPRRRSPRHGGHVSTAPRDRAGRDSDGHRTCRQRDENERTRKRRVGQDVDARAARAQGARTVRHVRDGGERRLGSSGIPCAGHREAEL